MRLSTRAYSELRTPKQIGFVPLGDSGSSMSQSNAAPNIGTQDSVSSAITQYVETITAGEARDWRNRNIWADIAIRQKMDNIRDAEHMIGAWDPKKPVNKILQTEIANLLEAPNEGLDDNTFGGLWGASMDDVYTIGHGCVQMILNANLTPRAFRALDAARMSHNPAYRQGVGDLPDSPDQTKRWIFQQNSSTKVFFSSPEIIMLVPYMSTHDMTGLSPMKALKNILVAELDTRRMMHGTQKFRTPPGVFVMPGAAPGSPEKMRLMYDLKMAGRPTIGFMNLPKDSRFVEFGGINLISQGTFQFYEICIRATAASFGTTPFLLGWTDQDNRANSQTQLTLSDRGTVAAYKFLRSIINRRIIGAYKRAYGQRAENLWFTFKALREEDQLEDATSLRTKAGPVGFISINEIRAAGGLLQYTEDEVGKFLWPFVSQPWLPSRIPNVMLPMKYAAMSWGIDENTDEALLTTMFQVAHQAAGTYQPPEGEDEEDLEIEGEQEAGQGKVARLRPQVTQHAYLSMTRGDASGFRQAVEIARQFVA